jgi:hypothetical protein
MAAELVVELVAAWLLVPPAPDDACELVVPPDETAPVLAVPQAATSPRRARVWVAGVERSFTSVSSVLTRA